MLPQKKRVYIKLSSYSSNSSIYNSQKNLDLKSFYQPEVQNENLIQYNTNSKLVETPKGTLMLKSKVIARFNAANKQTARVRKSYSIARTIKTNQKTINQSCASTRINKVNDLFLLPSEESYKEIMMFTQNVKKLLSTMGYSMKHSNLKSTRVMTADTEASDKLYLTKDRIGDKNIQLEDPCSSTRVSSIGGTERKTLESTEERTKTIDELSQESEEEIERFCLYGFEEPLPSGLARSIDLLGLKIAVTDIMFCQI